MSDLNAVQIEVLNHFFNNGGYVLDFSTPSFNDFTLRSVNISLCSKYGLSKGKSLREFFINGDTHLVGKLIGDLLDYYDQLIVINPIFRKSDDLFIRCKEIQQSLKTGVSLRNQINNLQNQFDSEYMVTQIKTMESSIDSNPTDAIGKAKELLESCLITILKNEKIEIDKNWDLPHLSHETCKLLMLTPEDFPLENPTSDTIRRILGNFANITKCLAELRNPHGSGHGKEADYKALSPRHAQLAVGSSVTAVQFIWDTYMEQIKNK